MPKNICSERKNAKCRESFLLKEVLFKSRSAPEASDGSGAVFYMDSMPAGGNPEKYSIPACFLAWVGVI